MAAQQENTRHNMAGEDISRTNADENRKMREIAQASLDDSRKASQTASLRDDIRQRTMMRASGANVTPQEHDEEIKIGRLPSSSYKTTPGEYQPLPPDQSGPGQMGDDSFQWIAPPVKAGQPANLRPETVKYKGKVVDANYNPDTGKYSLPTGEDITNDVQHYEKPPAPDRTLIWTDQGAIPRGQAAAAAAGGHPVQPQETAATRTMGEGARMLQPHIDDLKDQASQLDKDGMFGPVMSRIRHLAETAGTIDGLNDAIASDPELGKDRRIGRFATSLGLLATGAGRVHGGARGGGSPQMLAHFKAMLNDSASLDMFMGRLDAVDDYMAGYAAGPSGTANGAGRPAAPSTTPKRKRYDLNGNEIP